jgi:hypothetical protein
MKKRPFTVTSILWMVLCLTAWNTIRLGASILDWKVLAEFAPRPGPIYIAASASFWTLCGLALWRLILRRNVRVPIFASLFFGGYLLWWWADRLLLQSLHANWPFALITSLVLLAISFSFIFDKKAREFFHQRESHEQTHTDPNPA